jgi:hypothetical protein
MNSSALGTIRYGIKLNQTLRWSHGALRLNLLIQLDELFSELLANQSNQNVAILRGNRINSRLIVSLSLCLADRSDVGRVILIGAVSILVLAMILKTSDLPERERHRSPRSPRDEGHGHRAEFRKPRSRYS